MTRAPSICFDFNGTGFGLIFYGRHHLLGEAMQTLGDKNELAEPQQWAAEGFTTGQPHPVWFLFENKRVYGLDAKTASFPDNLFTWIALGYGGHDFDRQIIGPHLKSKTGIFGHAVTGNDAAIFDHRIPVTPVFHGGKNAPDYRQRRLDDNTFFDDHVDFPIDADSRYRFVLNAIVVRLTIKDYLWVTILAALSITPPGLAKKKKEPSGALFIAASSLKRAALI
jgi:hypothetical protein